MIDISLLVIGIAVMVVLFGSFFVAINLSHKKKIKYQHLLKRAMKEFLTRNGGQMYCGGPLAAIRCRMCLYGVIMVGNKMVKCITMRRTRDRYRQTTLLIFINSIEPYLRKM